MVAAAIQERSATEEAMPKGFKQTEIGLIPEDWEVVALGTLGEFKNGVNKSGDAFGSGYPFVNLDDVFSSSRIYSTQSLGLLETSISDRSSYDLQVGDVLFVRSSVKPSGVGLTAVCLSELPQTVFSGFLIRFRSKDRLATSFKEHCFHEYGFRKRLVASSSVSANTNIGQSPLKKLLIFLPPLPEQETIAGALTDADEAVRAVERLIEKKRAVKQAALHALLTPTTRLPGFDGAWETKLLVEVCDFVSGKAHEPYVEEFGDFIIVNSKFISTEGSVLKRCSSNLTPAKIGDIMIVMSDLPNGRALAKTFVADKDSTYAVNQRIARLRPRNADPTFIAAYLDRNDYFLKFDDGVSQTHLLNPVFKACVVPVPKIEEQRAIAAILSDMDAEIAALEARRDKLKAIKQGMMQSLLTGKVRLV